MVFRNFRINIILRVILLNLTILSILWIGFTTNYYITAFSLSLAAIIQVIFLIQYAERTNLMFTRFLNAIRYDDFSQNYTLKGLGKSFNELNNEFSKVLHKFQEIRAEKEAQYHYLKSVVQHIASGLIVVDEKGEIDLINNAARRILGIYYLNNVHQLAEKHQALVKYVDEKHSVERELIKINQADKILHLAVRMSEIKLMEKTYRIISLQDIQSELEDKEMEAWQNLIRVLTHEIINSVTPIASLAATIDDDLNNHLEQVINSEVMHNGKKKVIFPLENFKESLEEVHFAVKTIQRRSEGLIRFVSDFRSLTRIPTPNLQVMKVQDLIQPLQLLLKEEMKQENIRFEVEIKPENLEVIADAQLMEQVLINLLKNATHALEGIHHKHIKLTAIKNTAGKVQIAVRDNGVGINEEAIKKIFIPFFTTKKTGSGIGLSFSRQVMRLHGGNITVQSAIGEGTVFYLTFS